MEKVAEPSTSPPSSSLLDRKGGKEGEREGERDGRQQTEKVTDLVAK